MSNEARARTVREFIEAKERSLKSMCERIDLLNKAIPTLEQELETDKARLVEIERLIDAERD